MAGSVYKWLILPLLALALLSAGPHPFHVSVVEINHNAGEKSLEISCKLFTDDLEKVLAQNYRAKVDLGKPADKKAMDTLVKKYLFSHLAIRVNGRPAIFSYIGFEIEKEAVYGYIEADNIPVLSSIAITNSLMYDLFDDEVNIMHVIVNGNRKSTKLTYPDKDVQVSF